ncbi:tetratricopeptide repeat protein [Chondrinema litorale]|uniref:tetratricopeptide repeat protein n=1 Tax=Chondrinema litorale TaxID=2994555 RepID=UPI002542E320|nr:hypothetical protein [Chondrinema litorale]UZR93490.1 hypothetical protein OQ292_16675 [Chondrinema litorale]
MLNNNKSYPTNPLGTIAIFVFSIEAISASSLVALKDHYDLLQIITIFIVSFPTAIAAVFFVFLWKNREALYSPKDYQSDESFLKLSSKLNTLKQAELVTKNLPQNLDQVLLVTESLIKNGETRNAIKIGRGYLKLAEKSRLADDFEIALKVFKYLKQKVSKDDPLYYKIPTNIAYVKILQEKYRDATNSLKEAIDYLNNEAELYQLVPLAYCQLKLNTTNELENTINLIKAHPEFSKFEEYYPNRYEELNEYIKE